MSLLLKPFGTDRGGMTVEVTGLEAGEALRRRWQVVATGGDGPFIPAVPARAIVRKIDAISPGARPCLFDLTLKEIEDATRGLSVEFATSEAEAPPLFGRVLGGVWQALPAPIQRLHSVYDLESFCGRAYVTRGKNLLARFAAWLLNLPDAGEDVALTVTKERRDDGEVWERNFAGRKFRSYWSASRRALRLKERFAGFTIELSSQRAQPASAILCGAAGSRAFRCPQRCCPGAKSASMRKVALSSSTSLFMRRCWRPDRPLPRPSLLGPRAGRIGITAAASHLSYIR